jgi:hypothetical protein
LLIFHLFGQWQAARQQYQFGLLSSDIQDQQVKTADFQLIECMAKIVQRFDLQTIVRADDDLAV